MTHPPETTTPPAHVEDALDEALEESFPASDPVAIGTGELDKPDVVKQGHPKDA